MGRQTVTPVGGQLADRSVSGLAQEFDPYQPDLLFGVDRARGVGRRVEDKQFRARGDRLSEIFRVDLEMVFFPLLLCYN